ncbi:MAG TPA: type II toxin-antitoxin system RatA family toxin [Pseudomonadales bacterium]|nr:type II toxin-antitoxin system RatA family toxin [Pseudomonadales bacterium]
MTTRIERSALLLYPAPAMFDLVNDIESYPSFMDGCVGVEVLVRTDTAVEARLHLAKAGIRQSFTTRNLIEPGHIRLELVEGPFDSFEGLWGFEALRDDACKVSLYLAFRMRNALAGRAARKLFDSMANTLVDALCQRARQVYGER